jgi:hypothetical protein
VIRLSWKPRAFLLKKFLTDEECDWLVNNVSRLCRGLSACGWCACVRVHVCVCVCVCAAPSPAPSPGPLPLARAPRSRAADACSLPPPHQSNRTPSAPQTRAELTKSSVVDAATGKPMDSAVRTRRAASGGAGAAPLRACACTRRRPAARGAAGGAALPPPCTPLPRRRRRALHIPARSTGTFFQRGHNALITRIEERVAAVTMAPAENQEGLQILRYVDGQKYGERFERLNV